MENKTMDKSIDNAECLRITGTVLRVLPSQTQKGKKYDLLLVRQANKYANLVAVAAWEDNIGIAREGDNVRLHLSLECREAKSGAFINNINAFKIEKL